MDNLLNYMIRVSTGTTLLYLCYLLFFNRDTFYIRNRIFLILILVIPIIIPAIRIPVVSHNPVTVSASGSIDNLILPITSPITNIPAAAMRSFDFIKLLSVIYISITLFFLLRCIISVLSTLKIIKSGSVKDPRFPKVIVTDLKLSPFSFFPYIVIPAEYINNENYYDILNHENAHVKQGHTFDLVLSELFVAFQWFNPFIWLIKRSIVLNHEYLADYVSLKNKDIKEYQYMLLNFQMGLKNISMIHSFNSLIKNRIIMINKKPTYKYAILKNCLILPVVAIVAYAFATPEYHYSAASNSGTILQVQSKADSTVKGIVVNEEGTPVQGATVIISGTREGVSTDASGRFTIGNVKKDAHLIVSSNGYVSKYLEPDFSSEMKVEMSLDSGSQALLLRASFKNGPFPLIYIDGVESNKRLSEIDKSEIKGMMILSPENALKIYGEKGKNGVIMISTKEKGLEPVKKPSADTTVQKEVKLRNADGSIANILIVIDGVVSGKRGSEGLKELDPNDILSVSVLKEISATKKYGEKGKDGVIEITTKMNQPGNAQNKETELAIPFAFFAGKNSGSISMATAAKTDVIEVRSKDGTPAPGYEIKSFTLFFSQDGIDMEELSKGKQLTDKMKSLILNLKVGQNLIFKDIIAIGPDGKSRDLSPIILKIE